MVHADLKPSNVLFTDPNYAVLADFGLCVPAGSAAPGGSSGYLSPERLAGAPLQPDDDVYAFGRIAEDLGAMGTIPDAAGTLRGLSVLCLRPRNTRPRTAKELLSVLTAQGQAA
jgi:serine/threonine-protein kinase